MRAKQPSQRPDIGAPREEIRSWKAEAASQRVKYLFQRPGIGSLKGKQPSQRPDIGTLREEIRSWKAEAASQRVKYLSRRPGIDSLKGKLEVLRPKHGFVSIKSNGLCASPFIGVFLEKAFRRVQRLNGGPLG